MLCMKIYASGRIVVRPIRVVVKWCESDTIICTWTHRQCLSCILGISVTTTTTRNVRTKFSHYIKAREGKIRMAAAEYFHNVCTSHQVIITENVEWSACSPGYHQMKRVTKGALHCIMFDLSRADYPGYDCWLCCQFIFQTCETCETYIITNSEVLMERSPGHLSFRMAEVNN